MVLKNTNLKTIPFYWKSSLQYLLCPRILWTTLLLSWFNKNEHFGKHPDKLHVSFRRFWATYVFSIPYSLLIVPIFFSDMYIPRCYRIANTPILHFYYHLVSFPSFVLTPQLVPILFFSSAYPPPFFFINVLTSWKISYHPVLCFWIANFFHNPFHSRPTLFSKDLLIISFPGVIYVTPYPIGNWTFSS